MTVVKALGQLFLCKDAEEFVALDIDGQKSPAFDRQPLIAAVEKKKWDVQGRWGYDVVALSSDP